MLRLILEMDMPCNVGDRVFVNTSRCPTPHPMIEDAFIISFKVMAESSYFDISALIEFNDGRREWRNLANLYKDREALHAIAQPSNVKVKGVWK